MTTQSKRFLPWPIRALRRFIVERNLRSDERYLAQCTEFFHIAQSSGDAQSSAYYASEQRILKQRIAEGRAQLEKLA